VEVWQTSNLRRLRLGEEKKKGREGEEQTTGQKYNGLAAVNMYWLRPDTVGWVTERAYGLKKID